MQGFYSEVADAAASERLQRLGGELRVISPDPDEKQAIGTRSPDKREARFDRLRRQQDLIAALAHEIAASALEPCAEIQLAETNSGLSALSAYRDPELGELVATLSRRRQQLMHNLERDRGRIDRFADERKLAAENASPSEAVTAVGEFCKNSLDHGDGEMF